MIFKPLPALCAMSLCLLPLCNVAAEDYSVSEPMTLDTIEVVGRRRPSASASAVPLQTISRERAAVLGLDEVSEAVRRFSGVTLQDYGGIGGLKTVSVRGLGAKHTDVTYDGLSLTDAQSGQTDLSRFSLAGVDGITLSVGQPDEFFVPARNYARSSVLNIVTSRPQASASRRPYFSAMIKGASFGMFNPYLRYEQRVSRKVALTAEMDWLRADGAYAYTVPNVDTEHTGKRRNSDVDTRRAEANAFISFAHGRTLDAKFYYFDSRRGLPGSVVLYNDYSAERLHERNIFGQLRFRTALGQRFSLRADARFDYSLSRYADFRPNYPDGVRRENNTQNEAYISVGGLYRPFSQLEIMLSSDLTYNRLRNNLPECPLPERYTSQTVLAARLSDNRRRFTATASLLATLVSEHVGRGERPADRSRFSPAVALSWRVLSDHNLRLRASAKDAYRMPTFNDLYYSRIGNTGLRPERAWQFGAGLTWNGSPEALPFVTFAAFSADAYYNLVRDKIVAIPTLYIWKMMNIGRAAIAGIDVNASMEFALAKRWALQLEGNYSFCRAVDVTPDSRTWHHQMPYTPRHSGNASCTLRLPWFNLSYLVTAVGERWSMRQNVEANRMKAYTEQSVSAGRVFVFGQCRLGLRAELLNLAGTNYEVIRYYPMPGRSWRASLSIEF
ncbi:MAG: TonB-dependent receptor [Muribaculaceae bacterium]